MDVGELLHRKKIKEAHTDQINPLSHLPCYTIKNQKQSWYFESIAQVTLRKKLQNTSIVNYLMNNNKVNLILCFFRPLSQNQLKTIMKNNINSYTKQFIRQIRQQFIGLHQDEYFIYKIAERQNLFVIKWNDNFTYFPEQINPFIKQRITSLCQILKQQLQQILKQTVERFDLTLYKFDINQYKAVFISNIKLLNNDKIFGLLNHSYLITNDIIPLKINGQYKDILKQFYTNGKEQVPINTKIQQKWLKFKLFARKYQKQQNPSNSIPENNCKQINLVPFQEYQCNACNKWVVLSQFEPKRIITKNKISQIQYLIKMKMKTNINIHQKYDLVNICEICYKIYAEYYNNKQVIIEQKQKSKEKSESVNMYIEKQLDLLKDEKKAIVFEDEIQMVKNQLRKKNSNYKSVLNTQQVQKKRRITTNATHQTNHQSLNVVSQKKYFIPKAPRRHSVSIKDGESTKISCNKSNDSKFVSKVSRAHSYCQQKTGNNKDLQENYNCGNIQLKFAIQQYQQNNHYKKKYKKQAVYI